MTFKKNRLSVVIWIAFSLVFCTAYGMTLYRVLMQIPMPGNDGVRAAAVLLSFLPAAAIYVAGRKLRGRVNIRKKIPAEAVAFVFFLGAGLFLRCFFIQYDNESMIFLKDTAYYEAARVTGSPVASIAHGAQYIYVILLRGVFLLFGNHFLAGVMLQIVLQGVTAVLWYLAVRKISGAVTALTFLAGIMLLPQGIQSGLVYSPSYLYLLLSGVLLCGMAAILKREYLKEKLKWHSYLLLFLTGAGIGILTYLDVSGLVFLVPVCLLTFVAQKAETESLSLKEKGLRILTEELLLFVGFALTAAVLFCIDAWQSMHAVKDIFAVWCRLFGYKGIDAFATPPAEGISQWIQTGVLFLLLLGIPAFFIRKKNEIQLLWAFLLTASGVIYAGGFYAQGMNCDLLVGFFLLILTGAGLQAWWTEENPAALVTLESRSVSEEAVAACESTETEAKPRWIENPLPLPKKHVKKALEYRYEVSEEHMKYDIEVLDADDFDH